MALNEDGTGTVNGYHIGPDADLRGADLTGANLNGANLFRAQMQGADLSDAKMAKATLFRAELQNAILTNSDLEGADLTRSVLLNATMTNVNLQGATLTRSELQGMDLRSVNLRGARGMGADLSGADLSGVHLTGAWLHRVKMSDARLIGADLSGADLHEANLGDADLTDANLSGANLVEANLDGANLSGANLSGADLTEVDWEGANLSGADLTGAILPVPPRSVRSYGAMTGPILKIGKADSPARAAEYKKRYPAEFERLKADTSGRDFTDSLRESLRDKYRTPFEWIVTTKQYSRLSQRVSPQPNRMLLFNVDIDSPEYAPDQRALLKKLAAYLKDHPDRHPCEFPPLLTVGWIRYAQDDDHGVLLIEEVQSDVQFVRRKGKGHAREVGQLHAANIHAEDHAEVIELLRPHSSRFYEDAIGLVFQEAEALGYTVEMLGYGDKKADAPPSFYTDLPKRLGMTAKRVSEVPTVEPLKDKVSFYKPNPSKPSRRRK